MWPYKNHSESDYRAAVDYVESVAVKYGAKEVGLQTETFTDISGSWIAMTTETMKVFKYKDDYFRIEPHFLPNKHLWYSHLVKRQSQYLTIQIHFRMT